MGSQPEKWVCAHCGYSSQGKFVGDICPNCGLTYWKCSGCGFLLTAEGPPDVCHIASILTSYEKAPQGYRNVCIRAYRINRHEMPQLLDDLKKKATLLYLVDHRNDFRDIQYQFV
jgi:rubredoxin